MHTALRCSAAVLVHLAWFGAGAAAPNQHAVPCPPTSSHIVIEDGSYGTQSGVEFQLHHFSATLVPLGKTAPACLDKLTVVSTARIFVSDASMTTIFASKIDGADPKIKNLRIDNKQDRVTLSGSITKLIPIHFSLTGPVSTDGTWIRMEATSVKADGVPVKDLLRLLGEHLNNVFQVKGVPGVVVGENSVSISPELVAHLKGHIDAVRTAPEGLYLVYKPAAVRLSRATPATRHPY